MDGKLLEGVMESEIDSFYFNKTTGTAAGMTGFSGGSDGGNPLGWHRRPGV